MRKFFTIGVYAFVSWIIVLFLLTLINDAPRGFFIALHYFFVTLIFGLMFRFFYKMHSNHSAYLTTISTLIWLFFFEGVYWNIFSSDPGRFFNFVDWIFPAFLIATIVYAVKKRT